MRIQAIIIAASLLLAAPGMQAARTIKPFKAIYAVTYHGIPAGTVTRTLTIDNHHHYQFKAITKSALSLIDLQMSETSEGQWQTVWPHPNKYHYNQTVFKKSRDIVELFDWTKRIAQTTKAQTSKHAKHYTVKIPNDAQDKISYQLALREDLLNHKQTFSYPIADRHHVNNYTFEIMDHEVLKTPLGKIKTIKMQRTDMDDDDDIITFWLAPKYDYLLVKIIGANGGSTIADATIKSIG